MKQVHALSSEVIEKGSACVLLKYLGVKQVPFSTFSNPFSTQHHPWSQ